MMVHKSKTDEVSAGSKNRLKRTEKDSSGTTRSQLLLGAGRPGHLKVNGENVEITCTPAGKDRFQLQIALQSKISKGDLSTNIAVNKGQSIQLGSIVKDLRNKERTISINTGISYRKTKGDETATYTLVVE